MSFLIHIILLYFLFKALFRHEDSNSSRRTYQGGYQQQFRSNTQDNFIEALLVLIAAMMKADGAPKKVELDYVKSVLLSNLGEEKTKSALIRLRDILKMNIDINSVCMNIRYSVNYSVRLQIIHILFGIAKADGVVADSEKNLVAQIAYAIGLSVADIESLFGTYHDFGSKSSDAPSTLDAAYKVLEISKDASDDDIKKAYRNMAKKYHPDTVAELGEEAQKAAEMKFRKVQEAYEKVKAARGMK